MIATLNLSFVSCIFSERVHDIKSYVLGSKQLSFSIQEISLMRRMCVLIFPSPTVTVALEMKILAFAYHIVCVNVEKLKLETR